MQSSKEIASLSVTPSGCPMFQELAARLHILHNVLALPLFHQAWKSLASQLDQVLQVKKIVVVSIINELNFETFFLTVLIRRSCISKSLQ